jgi:hypothetical protein
MDPMEFHKPTELNYCVGFTCIDVKPKKFHENHVHAIIARARRLFKIGFISKSG